MKEIFLINSHTETTEKLDNLRELIKNIKSNGYEICLITHTSTPQDIVDRCDYFIYDKKNPIVDNPEVQYWLFFKCNNYHFASVSKHSKTHFLAYYRLIFGGLSYLKSLGYDVVHSYDYDIVFNSFDEIKNNTKLLHNYDIISYHNNDNLDKFTYFSINLGKLDISKMVYNETDLYNHYKTYHENSKFPLIENILYDEFLPKNIYVKPISELEKTSEINTHRMIGNNITISLFPYENKLFLFSLDSQNTKSKIDVIYNNIVLSFESLYGKYYYIDEISNIENIKVFLDNVLYSEHNLSSDLDYLTEYTSFTKFN
jgi:hypothetical protein